MLPASASTDQLITAIQENLFAHMLFFPERLDSFTVLKAKELVITNSHAGLARLNQVMRARLAQDHAAQAVKTTVDYMRREQVPFQWVVSPDDMPDDLPMLLKEQGLQLHAQHYGMHMAIAERSFEQMDLRVERVTSPLHVDDFAEVVFDAYGDAPALKHYYQQITYFPFRLDDIEQFYVGYLDDEPISCGKLTLHAGVAGLHCVATKRVHRRQGFATAMVHELLMRAQAFGFEQAVMQVSASHRALFEKVGFQPLCDFFIYELAEL